MATFEDSINIRVHVHTRHRDLDVAVQDFLDQGFVTLELGHLVFYFSSLEQLEQLEKGVKQVRDFLDQVPF